MSADCPPSAAVDLGDWPGVKSSIGAAYRKIGVDSRSRAVLWGVDHRFRPDTIRAGTGLLEALHQWRDTAGTPTSECHVSEHRAIDANRATIEHAKGALMRRYGMDTFQAFSLMVRWARLTHTPVHTLAKTLVEGIGEADPQPERRHRPLIRWLEAQLQDADP